MASPLAAIGAGMGLLQGITGMGGRKSARKSARRKTDRGLRELARQQDMYRQNARLRNIENAQAPNIMSGTGNNNMLQEQGKFQDELFRGGMVDQVADVRGQYSDFRKGQRMEGLQHMLGMGANAAFGLNALGVGKGAPKFGMPGADMGSPYLDDNDADWFNNNKGFLKKIR